MKALRKLMLLVVFVFITIASFVSTTYAADTVKNDAGNYNYTTTNEDTRTIANGVEAIVNTGYTTRSSKNYDQRVSIFTADFSKNSDIKVASWAIENSTNTGFTRKGLLDIAKDYEANNPGWIVLAGINADQYYQKTGTGLGTNGSTLMQPQPYYPLLSNGDNLFVATPYGFSTNFVGIKNDGSTKPFVSVQSAYKGFHIHIYNDNNEEIGDFPIDGLNCDLGTNKTVVIAGYRQDENTYATVTRTSENDIYVVGNSDLSYVSSTVAWKSWDQYAVDGFFGKGKITEITHSITYNKEVNSFAIETDNDELKALLGIGTYIKVQIDLGDEFDGIEEGVGFHTVQRKDGADKNVDNSYNTRAYPRSMFGCDANGKIYLMTCFGDNASPLQGLYAQEANALCKKYGIVDFYQMDGGGSVTCVARDENGILNYAEACIEASHSGTLTYSSYRYILSGLFIVMKVPEASATVTEVSQDYANINVNTSKLKADYNKAVVRVTDPTTSYTKDYNLDLTLDENIVNITDLSSNKQYNYELFVQKTGFDEQTTYITGSFNTYKTPPIVLSISAEKVDTGVKVTIRYNDENKALVKLKGKVGTRDLAFDSSNGVATLIVKDTYKVLDMKIIAECVLDPTDTKHQNVELDLVNLSYPPSLYFDYVVDYTGVMIGEFFK